MTAVFADLISHNRIGNISPPTMRYVSPIAGPAAPIYPAAEPLPGGSAGRLPGDPADRVEFGDRLGGQLERCRSNVFAQVGDGGRTGDQQDVR